MEMIITVNKQGQINVKGPIENKLFCYGMLELAKEAIADHHRQISHSSIVPATELPRELVR